MAATVAILRRAVVVVAGVGACAVAIARASDGFGLRLRLVLGFGFASGIDVGIKRALGSPAATVVDNAMGVATTAAWVPLSDSAVVSGVETATVVAAVEPAEDSAVHEAAGT